MALKRSRIRSVNPERRRRLFQECFGGAEYVKHITSLPCALCGSPGPNDPAHVRSRGAGGKAPDQVPLCRPDHVAMDQARLPADVRASLAVEAARLWAEWCNETDDRVQQNALHRPAT